MVETSNVDLCLPRWLFMEFQPQLTIHILLEYLKLLLFQRCQIPEPVLLMQRKIKETNGCGRDSRLQNGVNFDKKSRPRANNSYIRKCKELLQKLTEIEEYLFKIIAATDHFEAAITIGPTPLNFKEGFTMKCETFEKGATQTGDSHPKREMPSSVFNAYSRRLCMMMVESSLNLTSEPSLTKTRVFVRMPKSVSETGAIPWQNFHIPIRKLHVTMRSEDNEDDVFNDILDCTSDLSLRKVDVADKENHSNRCRSRKDVPCNATKPRKFSATEASELASSALPTQPRSVPPNADTADVPLGHDSARSCSGHDMAVPAAKARKSSRLSAEQALNAVMASPAEFGDDALTSGVCSVVSNAASACRTSDAGASGCNDKRIWFQIPVTIQGFKS